MQVALTNTGFAIGATEGPHELIKPFNKEIPDLSPTQQAVLIKEWMQDEDNKLLVLDSAIQGRKLQFQTPGQVSDGYHTFDELYEHRIALYMALVQREYNSDINYWGENRTTWMTQMHSDGTIWEGWFILGMNYTQGEQITYYIPMKEWDTCTRFAEVLKVAPVWDGHTSADVLERLKRL